MARGPMPRELLPDLVAGLAEVLGSTNYAVMGGIALWLLGATRHTSDIDLFVPKQGLQVANKIADSNNVHFGAYKDQRKTIIWYRGLDGHRYRVYIWEPRQIGHTYPLSATDLLTIKGVRVLKSALLLDHKCKCWAEYVAGRDQVKYRRDAGDIIFLLNYMGNKRLRTTNQEVSHATPEFFGNFLPVKRESEALFCMIGLLQAKETDSTTVARGSEQGVRVVKRAPS